MSPPHGSFVPDEAFMLLAIQEARNAQSQGDYAIGAVVVLEGRVVSRSGNRIKQDCDPTQHAEVSAIRMACSALQRRHIEGAVLYTTSEPCPMCASAAIWARMSGIVSGSTMQDMSEYRSKFGNNDWTWRTVDIAARAVLSKGEPQLFLIESFLHEECRELFHAS